MKTRRTQFPLATALVALVGASLSVGHWQACAADVYYDHYDSPPPGLVFDQAQRAYLNERVHLQGVEHGRQRPGYAGPPTNFTNTFFLRVGPLAQVLTLDQAANPTLVLVAAGTPVQAGPPAGAVWATGTAITFYRTEGYTWPTSETTDTITLTAQYGPFAEHPDGFIAGRYSAGDGWHYGWIQLVVNWPGSPRIGDYRFHPQADKAIWAGEEPYPRLRAAVASGTLVLLWRAHEDGYVLEVASSLSAPSWTPVEGVTANGIDCQASLPLAPGTRFFRLRK